jgi:CRISPR-associated protein Csb2
MVAAGAGAHVASERRTQTVEALRWLERQRPPEIIAPPGRESSISCRFYVPDNVGDIVAKAWSAGRAADLAEYRSEKDVRPVRIEGEQPAIQYVYAGVEELSTRLPALRAAARSLTHLGWGIDMVAGDASDATASTTGERWMPGRRGARALRCPVPGTFDALERKHQQFLHRLEGGTFRPVSPLSMFAIEPYARATDVAPKPFAAFRLLEPITGDRLFLDPKRRTRDVAAWTRHAVAEVCEGWPFGSTQTLVHGHGQGAVGNGDPTERFAFLPLPTLNPRLRRVEGVTRVAVVGPEGFEEQIEWVRARLSGRELEWQGEAVAFLEPLPEGDWVLDRYVRGSDWWSTVTPVVLPGFDDRSPAKQERLLIKAFLQAGLEKEVLAEIRSLDWRKVGFRAGLDLAHRYLAPDKVSGPMFHVRVQFGRRIRGPLAIGSGRFRGMGVFAVHENEEEAAAQRETKKG